MSIRNVFESIVSDEDTADPEEPSADGAADAADGAGEFAGFEDDDGAGFGEDAEALGDSGDFGSMDGGDGAAVDDLEHRIDEVETELEDISSTVETVRTENEQVSASVNDVEENVRKLLDIYEMVTNGVNPFADDVEAGMGGGMNQDFGLFDDEGGDSEADDGIDEDVAEADPEGFFDDDLDEEDLQVDDAGAGPAGDGGTSFEDLKAEYDEDASTDANADGGQEAADPDPMSESTGQETSAAGIEGEPAQEPVETDEPSVDPAPEPSSNGDTPPADDGGDAAEAAPAHPETAPAADPKADPAGAGGQERGPAEPDPRQENGHDDDDKPYLSSLPDGYATDLVVVEWLEYLVGEAGVREAADAIEYYESLDWLNPTVARGLRRRLGAFEDGGDGTLSLEDHARSLRYIGELSGRGQEAAAVSLSGIGGGTDGLQR